MNADCLKLTSYFGERHRTWGTFVADSLIELYGRHEIAASILLRGTEGFGLKHHLRTDRLLTPSEDLPLIAIAVDTRPRIEAVLALTPLPRPVKTRAEAGVWPRPRTPALGRNRFEKLLFVRNHRL